MSVYAPFEVYLSNHNQYLGHGQLLTMHLAQGSSMDRSRPPPGADPEPYLRKRLLEVVF